MRKLNFSRHQNLCVALAFSVFVLATMSASATSVAAAARYPATFLFHGGGPLPLLGDAAHEPLVASWRVIMDRIIAKAGLPSAIVVVSAHYETDVASVGAAEAPSMLYDYGGFPPESYKIKYSAPGSPSLAHRLVSALEKAGIRAVADPKRPFDHGVFVPLIKLFPEANIPVVPLSVLSSQDAAQNIAVGQALQSFRTEKVFFLGSGASMHHFGNLFSSGRKAIGTTFNNELTRILCDTALSNEQRVEAMKAVKSFQGVSESHPPQGFEHLMPLLTVVGATGGAVAEEVSNMDFLAANMRQYVFWA